MTPSTVSPEVRSLCLVRAGFRCEYCHGPLDGVHGYSLQHRKARGMGGSRDHALAQPPNLLVLCGSGVTGHHGWVEHNPATAYDLGLALRTGWDPEQTPYRDQNGVWRLLLLDGSTLPIQLPWRIP